MRLGESKRTVAPGEPYLVETIARACDVLRSFKDGRSTLRLCEVASRAELNKATAYRILFTLEQGGLVERTPERGYRLTFRGPQQSPYRLACVKPPLACCFLKAVYESIQRAAFEQSFDLITVSPMKSRTQRQRTAEFLVREKADLLIQVGGTTDEENLVPDSLRSAGIAVIGVEAHLAGAMYYGIDNFRSGLAGGQFLALWASQHWRGSADDILLVAPTGGGCALESRIQGFALGIRHGSPEAAEPKILKFGGDDRLQASQSAVRKYLKTSRSRRILIGAADDLSAMGAVRAFEEAGRGEDCAVAGQGGSAEACRLIREGKSRLVATVAFFPDMYGDAVLSFANKLMRQRNLPQALFARHQLITRNNVSDVHPAIGERSFSYAPPA